MPKLPDTRQVRRTIKGVAIVERPKSYYWRDWEGREPSGVDKEGRPFIWDDLVDRLKPGTAEFEKTIQSLLSRWWRESFAAQFHGDDAKWHYFCSLKFESYKVRPIRGSEIDVIRIEVTYSEPVSVYVVTYNGSTMAGSYNHLYMVFDDKETALALAAAEGDRYSVIKKNLMEPGRPTRSPDWL